MKREEILQLHTLTEEEQIEWLSENMILQPRNDSGDEQFESLADCAFRLRDEEWGKDNEDHIQRHPLLVGMEEVDRHLFGETIGRGGSRFWMYGAKPIHWIQAALLAKLTAPSHPQA